MNNNLWFLSKDRCDMFSYLRGIDLQELLILIEGFDLVYRDSLNLDGNVSFGVEIEYEKVSKLVVNKFINKNFSDWKSTFDESVLLGGEIISSVLFDNVKTWQELKNICQFLDVKNAYSQGNAGGHIHIGAHILGNDLGRWNVFLKLITIYEHIIFRFSYGDKINERKNLLMFSFPIASLLKHEIMQNLDSSHNNFKSINDVFNSLMLSYIDDKYHSVNFRNIDVLNAGEFSFGNTIEFRCANATTKEVIWQNNINMFTKLMLSASPLIIDEDFLDYKLREEFVSSDKFYLYNERFLKDALEFVDLIFDNNLDKVYFLRQYFKCFDNGYGYYYATKARKFYR